MCPTLGFLGNPSDGFEGKTVSFTLANYNAEVTLQPLVDSKSVEIIPNPQFDVTTFSNVEVLAAYTSINVKFVLLLKINSF